MRLYHGGLEWEQRLCGFYSRGFFGPWAALGLLSAVHVGVMEACIMRHRPSRNIKLALSLEV